MPLLWKSSDLVLDGKILSRSWSLGTCHVSQNQLTTSTEEPLYCHTGTINAVGCSLSFSRSLSFSHPLPSPLPSFNFFWKKMSSPLLRNPPDPVPPKTPQTFLLPSHALPTE